MRVRLTEQMLGSIRMKFDDLHHWTPIINTDETTWFNLCGVASTDLRFDKAEEHQEYQPGNNEIIHGVMNYWLFPELLSDPGPRRVENGQVSELLHLYQHGHTTLILEQEIRKDNMKDGRYEINYLVFSIPAAAYDQAIDGAVKGLIAQKKAAEAISVKTK